MKKTITILIFSAFCILNFGYTGCKFPYSFKDASPLPPNIKTVNVHIIDNQAQSYVNPQLSPNLTDRLKQKVTRQTKLTQTNNDNADLDIRSAITGYTVTTTGVSSANGQTQASINRLTVSVHVIITNQRETTNNTKEVDVSRSFDFPANQSLNQAEGQLLDEMVRNLSDEIFNRIFSDW